MSDGKRFLPRTDEDTGVLKRGPYRPGKPARRGVGYFLRHIAGVEESILDWAPEERHRYSLLGGVLLNTGLMAALSMLVLLGSHSVPVAALIPAAMLWGHVILTLDRRLVADTHGTSGMRAGMFLARLAISILMGVVVAEPLLLWMFSSDVNTQIGKERTSLIDTYEGTLKRCNTLSGEPPADPAGCTREFALNIPGPPQPLLGSKSAKEAERVEIQEAIKVIDAEIRRREDLARRECNGTRGTGLSGQVGEGPNCRQLRSETATYIADSGRSRRQAELDATSAEIAKIDGQLSTVRQVYAEAVTATIKEKTEGKAAKLEKPGLLDQSRALEHLTSENRSVLVYSWLLRLLLVLVDALPVIIKRLSRFSTYDGMLSRQLIVDDRLHERTLKYHVEREIGDLDVQIQENEQAVRLRKERIEEHGRDAEADRQAGLDAQIEELARRLRGDA
ncbi:DUF4407 domain-containing protein [Micromonospora sp. NBC_00421]|uniref:DUF4407 domain-containing protein n=1 Tax=Micromonospora sp. NBC_00421 TaxID=2975976 RepID=UPI002E20F53D